MLPSCHSNLQDLGQVSSGPHGSRWCCRDRPYCKGPSYNLENSDGERVVLAIQRHTYPSKLCGPAEAYR